MRRTAHVRFRLLGTLEVGDGDRTVDLPRGRARSLLGLLALHPGEVLSRDRLVDALWGGSPPPTATTALQGLISALRKRLEPERDRGQPATILVTHPPGYVLAIEGDQVDAHRFRRLVDEARGAPAPERARRLRAALALWRGPALADFTYEPFAQAPITALEKLRITALEARIGADLELGRHAEVVAELEGLLAEHPLREALHAHLMLARYRMGRQAEALEVYRDLRRHLVDELGVEPGPHLRELQRAVLRQDPSLEPPQVVVAPDAGREAEEPWIETSRRTVTVAFIDLSLASPATGGADMERIRPVVTRAHQAVRDVVERHGGSVETAVGDVVVAAFGLPVAHEDDAERAVRAASAIRRALSDVNDAAAAQHGMRLAARIGIDTGEVVVAEPVAAATGAAGRPLALAARLQQAATDGTVLLSDSTRRLVQPVALVEPAPASDADPRPWRLLDVVDPPTGLLAADTTLVGRERELTELADALHRAVRGGRASLVTVLGEAGVGKSRLARAFTDGLDDARVVVGRCRAYGDGITFWPLREIVQDLAGGVGRDGIAGLLEQHARGRSYAAQIAAAIGLAGDPVERPTELFRAVRQLFEAAAGAAPLVVVIEDVHWAQPTLLDLVEYLADEVRAPVLLACLARPELLEHRPSWALELDATTRIGLQPLGTAQARRLVTDRLAGRLLAPETMGHVLAMGEGNPLFLEQLLAALREDHELTLPSTIQALLTARLDRLGPAERDVLRAASVVGSDVSLDALTALVPDPARRHLRRHLAALTTKELIRPWEPSVGSGFDFRHVLIQQAAYRSVTHAARADLHARLAEWLESDPGGEPVETEELIGHHLEQAVRHRRDLGRSGAETGRLAVRAGELLASAGLRAYARFDVPAAENLLSRARALLPSGHRDRPSVLRRLTEAYPVMGRSEQAEEAFAELVALAEGAGDSQARRGVRIEQLRFRLITGPDPIPLADIEAETEETLEAYRRAGDDVGVSQAHYVLASVHLRAGRMTELEQVARRGIERARRTGDLREQLGAPWWVVFAMLAGPTPVPDCVRACEDVADAGGLTHLGVLAALGHFKAMLGDIQEGRRLVARAHEILRERIRIPRPLAFIGQRSAGVEQLAGRPDLAARALREALDVSLRVAERDQSSQIAAQLSLLLAQRGEDDEAAHLADLASSQAPSESVSAQAFARAAGARTALVRGDLEQGEVLARQAIAQLPDDMLELRALLHVVLAQILGAAGRPEHAHTITEAAVDLYERKGNLTAARSTPALVTPPGRPRSSP